MALDELSPECKQTLRDLDHSLGSTRAVLSDLSRSGYASAPASSSLRDLSQDLTQSFSHLDTLDDPCRRVLRDLDHTSAAISRLNTTQPHTLSVDTNDIADLLDLIDRAIVELRPYLNL